MAQLAIAPQHDAGPTGVFSPRRPAEAVRAFQKAHRHSRWVRTLRIAIPAALLAAVLGMFLAHWLNPLRVLRGLPVDLGNILVSGTKVTMEAPRVAGFTRDQRAFEFMAKSAAQDLTKPDLVELQMIQAKVALPDNASLTMSARSGVYDTKKDLLTLSQDILLATPGYQGVLREALVDLRAGRVVSDQPVELKMLQGVLNANRLEITDSGDFVRFSGGVTVQIDGRAMRGEKVGGQ